MGSLPKLKIKDELRYRKGSTCETMNCKYCLHLTSIDIPGKGQEPRCKIIGVRESIRYRIRDDFRCDQQVPDETKFDWLWKTKRP